MAWYKDPERKIRADIPPISSTEVKILGTVGPVININDDNFVLPKNIVSTSATISVSSGPTITYGYTKPAKPSTTTTTTTTTPAISGNRLPANLRPPQKPVPLPPPAKSFSVPMTATSAKFYSVKYGITKTTTITSLSTYDYNN